MNLKKNFECPICRIETNVIRKNDNGEEFISICKCGMRVKGRIFLK